MMSQEQNVPLFFMEEQALNVVNKARHWGHIIRDDLCGDDDGVQQQTCKMYAHANILVHSPFMSRLLCTVVQLR